MYIFTIWDNREQTFYTKNDRFLWATKSGAIDAVMFNFRSTNKTNYMKYFKQDEVKKSWLKSTDENYIAFENQIRYECRKYCLKESDYEIVQ